MTTPRISRSRVLRTVALTAAVAFGLAACGASGGSDGAKTTTTAKATTTKVAADDTTTTGDDTGTTVPDPAEPTTTTGATTEPTDPDGPATASDYAEALATAVKGGAPPADLTEAKVDCFTAKWVDLIGLDRFQAANITPAAIRDGSSNPQDLDFTKAETVRLVTAMIGCGVNIRHLIVDGVLEDSKATPAQKACVERVVTVEVAAHLYATSLLKDLEILGDKDFRAAYACLPEAERPPAN